MNYFFRFLFSVILVTGFFSFQSCDKIEAPYKESSSEIPDTVEVRKFLLEEFTGHTCPNCPQGNVIAQQLKDVYGERLVTVSIHFGGFAEPGNSPFTDDFRSATGDEIGGFFSLGGFPSGMISRNGWSAAQNNADIGKDAWGPRIESLKDLQPIASLGITNTYNSGSRTVNAAVQCSTLTDLNKTYKVAVFITEDSIVAPQLTLDTIWHSYIHRHMLRGSMNGAWGETLISGNTSSGSEFSKNYSSTLDAAWNENHCYLIAFIYDAENYEIMQVEEKKIK